MGATGLVGREMLSIVHARGIAGPNSVMAFASSAGRTVPFGGSRIPVEVLDPSSVGEGDFLLGATSASAAAEWVEACASAGAVVVDNSSAFRMRDDVPLVVPEVNPCAMLNHRGIIANPNCSTIQLVVALAPIVRAAEVLWVAVSTYQAVSGAGRDALEALRAQAGGRTTPGPVYHANVLPEIGAPGADGYCGEERKLILETPKILGTDFPVVPACARVGVEVGHTESVSVMLSEPMAPSRAVELLEAAEGVSVSGNGYPPRDLAGSDAVGVGRVRSHPAEPRLLQFWVTADNLRKGAALNAVQILERLIAAAD